MDFGQLKPSESLIVTASNRQARFIREKYQQAQIEAGLSVWQSLNVIPWSAFLDKCWNFLVQTTDEAMPIRLNKEQSQYLWQQLVSNSKHTEGLLNTQQTVKLSNDAWRMLQQWQVSDFSFNHGDSDQEAFAEWYFEYKKQLRDNQWIDTYQVANQIIDNFQQIAKLLPKQVAFYGFQQTNPQQEAIFKKIKQYASLETLNIKNEDNVLVEIKSAETPEQEIIAAIQWAKNKLEENQSDLQNFRLAILIPDLEQQRAYVERVLQRELYPQEFFKGETANHWHDISVAEKLDSQPLIKTVLTLLKLLETSITKDELRTLLLSPYLYSTHDKFWQASQLELDIRKSNKAYYSTKELNDWLLRKEIELDWLVFCLNHNENALNQFNYHAFIEVLLKLLESLQWSGFKSLSSREFQLQQHFLEVIKSSAKLIRVTKTSMSWSQALKVLTRFVQEQSFHQETPSAPLKIMGMLEAVAIEFDAIWVVGATDKVLPQKNSVNPFISKAIQLKYNLPGSSHQRELDYAQALINSLVVKEQLIFSYATHDGEQEQLLSPLLKSSVDKGAIQPIEFDSLFPKFIKAWPLSQLETYQDNVGLPFETDGYAAGGTGLLKVQAASPFDAYLRYRLNLYPFDADDLGVSFLDRGNIFHKIMQALWQHLQTQQKLLNHSDKELDTLVERTITTILNIESKHLYLLNHKGFFATEKKRLKALVQDSLAFDKNRVAFKVIATEARRQIEVGGLKLNISIDRIDQLDDGSLLIIDYKTGVPKLIDLMNDPIGEPQLLLYAISEHKEEHPVAGILFYQAHLKASKYVGFTEDTEMIKGIKALKELATNPYADDFDSAIEQWREMLNEIAESFKSGEANITDYSGNYLDYHLVSRWHERGPELEQQLENFESGVAND